MVEGRYINDLAIRKAIKTIKLFKKLCSAYNIQSSSIIPVATAAVRKAENRDDFLKLLFNLTGLKFNILSGDEEALYVYKAVISSIDIDSGVIVDIGGGSTEIIKFSQRSVINHISIPIGAIVATEEFLGKNAVSPESIRVLDRHLESVLSGLGWLSTDEPPVIIGLGGTIRNMAKIHRKRFNYPLEAIHNYMIPISDFYSIYDYIKSLDLEARKKIEGMSSSRADILVGGLTILKAISSITRSSTLVISGNGLREGIMFEYIMGRYPEKRFTNVLDFSLDNLIEMYSVRQDHSRHICDMALSMFDQLKPLHRLDNNERRILRAAALLHDIGISVNYYRHYIHSFYMILNSKINGLSHREIVMTAIIAACHEKEKLKKNFYKDYEKLLLRDDEKILLKLSLILRISESLDRSETRIVKSLICQIDSKSVKIKTHNSGDAELEINLSNENASSFKKLFKRELLIT